MDINALAKSLNDCNNPDVIACILAETQRVWQKFNTTPQFTTTCLVYSDETTINLHIESSSLVIDATVLIIRCNHLTTSIIKKRKILNRVILALKYMHKNLVVPQTKPETMLYLDDCDFGFILIGTGVQIKKEHIPELCIVIAKTIRLIAPEWGISSY